MVVPVEEFGDRLCRHACFAAQYIGRDRSVSEAYHLIARVAPGSGRDAQHGGLAAAGGTDNDFKASPVARDGAECVVLVGTESCSFSREGTVARSRA